MSAYDLNYQHLPNAHALLEGPPFAEPYGLPEVLFVDSGCYEAEDIRELADSNLAAIQRHPWDLDRLTETLKAGILPDSAVIHVNFDCRASLAEQMTRARDFFAQFPTWRHDFLIKPSSDDAQLVPLPDIIASAGDLRAFDIVGFTEKELGRSLLDRLITIAKVRDAMDDAAVRAPIHVFGSLDPVLSLLYFVAGAEIFDGLSWLYMAFRNGQATYRDAASALDRDWTSRQEDRRSLMLHNNLVALRALKTDMENIVATGGVAVLGERGDFVHDAEQLIVTKVGPGRGR